MFSKFWRSIIHDKLFSTIYIFGTALALASTTVAVVVLNSMIAPVYPEYNRLQSAFISQIQLEVGDTGSYQYSMSYDLVRDQIYTLKNATEVSAYMQPWNESYITPADGGLELPVTIKPVDPAFFEVYNFRFLAGRPISREEFESGLPVAVIGENTARETFGSGNPEDYLGKTVTVDFADYKVVGVVKEPTHAQTDSYAGVYMPYTSHPEYNEANNGMPCIGPLKAVIVTDDIDALKAEIDDFESRFNSSQQEYQVHFFAQPMSHTDKALGRIWYDSDFSLSSIALAFAVVILSLLLIPSFNLSGIISGHMETRIAEMGLRKSFGATRSRLLREVLVENLSFTLAGGIIGYALAYIILKCGIADMFQDEYIATDMTNEMIFSPIVFVSVFIICTILNTISGLIPVYHALRRPIVQSLNEE